MKILNTLFLLLLTISNALAEETDSTENLRQYDIEIIIFEDAHARYLNSETWHQEISAQDESSVETETNDTPSKNLDKLSTSEINATTYQALEPAILNDEYKRIKNSAEYKVLSYTAWRQTGLDKSTAFEIDTGELNNIHTSTSKNTISGTFKIVLARYLHFYSDLDYQRQVDKKLLKTDTVETKADSPTGSETTDVLISEQSYSMQIHRRMRSKELHYIDHPLVGLLIQINPVEKTEQKEKL